MRNRVLPRLQVQRQRRAVVDPQDLRLDPVHDAGLVEVFVEVGDFPVVKDLLKTQKKANT